MKKISWVRRAVLPGILLIAGAAALVYGAAFNVVPVVEEQKKETVIEIPIDLPPEMSMFPGGMPLGRQPEPIKKVVTTVELISVAQSEPSLMREVSIGGVALLPTGQLKRTYSGKGPALCPS